MRIALLLALGVSFLLPADRAVSGQTGPPTRLTEAQALQRLSAYDPRLRAAGARVDQVRAAQAVRVVRANPTFTFSRESVGDLHDEFFLGRQEFDLSGRLGYLRAAGRFAVEAAEADARHQVVQLQSAVRDAFTVLVLAQERETVIAAGLSELARLLEILRTREREGEGSRYDRMRGQRAWADLDADLATASAARAEAQGRLAALFGDATGNPLAAEGHIEPAPPAPDRAALVERALAIRADLQALTIAASQFRAERAAADRLRIPTPTVVGGLKRSGADQQVRSGYVFSLDVSVPLFNRGQSAVAGAQAQFTGADAQAVMLRQQIQAEVRVAHAVFDIHRQKAERYRASTSETANDLLAVARLGYEEGELGILELLDALRQSLDGRVRGLEMLAAARRAAIELDRVVGLEIKP